LKKRFHKQAEKINNSKNPEKIAKNYLKIYKGFKSDFDGWFKSFDDYTLGTIKCALLSQYILYKLKALQRDQDLIYDLLEYHNYSVDANTFATYFGITNCDCERPVSDITWE
jgi:hypothetical protein